ncbi:EAL domain-containing protein [Frankia sp. AgKG'84/4]|uniref:EAL domain-containing protein n=1 Tax=Frankia sp. AgKG'84/4 TaxID=573490 RepID=UPI00200E6588|nr:EAL domain-containing protein [Frankia sp. AgKG'84/4]MCL9794682.1 EAL domain-containing protein [Frankia sp. AgKG'84/4]
MYSDHAYVDRARLLTLVPLGAVALFLLVLLTPGSPDRLSWQAFVALAVSVLNVIAGLVAQPRRVWVAPVAALTFAAVLALGVAETPSAAAAAMYLVWFPPLCASVALIRTGAAVLVVGLIVVALLAGATAHGDTGGVGAPAISSALCTVMVGVMVKGLFRVRLPPKETDTLTRLPNRRGILERGERAVADIRSSGREAVLVLVDINHFHEFNDALGHAGGDRLLQAVAGTLGRLTPSPALVGRAGGDEFVLICAAPAATLTGATRALGQRVLRQLQGPFEVDGVDVALDASAGIAVAPHAGRTVAELLACADSALSRARRTGESIGVWDPAIVGVKPEEIALYADLCVAIERDELVLFYQPLQSAHSGQIVGVEALLRWQHPTRGLLPPGAFLPMAERSAIISDLTGWVLNEACRQCAAWAAAGLHLVVSVNLSPRMLVLDDLPQRVVGALSSHGLTGRSLTLEITESVLVADPARAATILRELRAEGINLSLDDFGTGYSSMEILNALPFNEVKIDRGFVTDASGNLPAAAIVRSVVDLGHRLGLRVVCEGVASQRTLAMMIDLGCDLLQGEAVSDPLPAARLSGLLRARAPAAPRRPAPPGADQAAPSRQEELAGSGSADRAADTTPAEAIPAGPGVREPSDLSGLAALGNHHVLRTEPEAAFDDLASIAARSTGCLAATIVFDGRRGVWSKTRRGPALSIIAEKCGIGARVVAERAFVEVQDLAGGGHPYRRYAADEQIRFAAGMPIAAQDGRVLGALVVVDRVPRRLTSGQRANLVDLSRQVSSLLDAGREATAFRAVAGALADLDRLSFPDDLDRAGTIITAVTRALLDATEVALMTAQVPGSTFYRVVGACEAPGTVPMVSVGEEPQRDRTLLMERVMRTQCPVFLKDGSASSLMTPGYLDPLRVGSLFVLPLPGEGGLLGVIGARWEKTRDDVDPVIVRALTVLARQAAHTLIRLRADPEQANAAAGHPAAGSALRP